MNFYTVASSLPGMSASFKVAETPISRAQLDKRLNMLPAEDARLLFQLELLVWSSWFMPQMPVGKLDDIYRDLLNKDLPVVHEIADWFLNLRSIFAVLRMRHAQKTAPERASGVLLGSRASQLIQRWDEPDFGLKSVYPWLPDMAAAIDQHESMRVEEFLLSHIWQYLCACGQGHYFDLRYLISYVLRWNVVNYWSKLDRKKAAQVLDELCTGYLQASTIGDPSLRSGRHA